MTQEMHNNETDSDDNLNQSFHLDTQYIFMPIQLICCKLLACMLYLPDERRKYFTVCTHDSCSQQLSEFVIKKSESWKLLSKAYATVNTYQGDLPPVKTQAICLWQKKKQQRNIIAALLSSFYPSAQQSPINSAASE